MTFHIVETYSTIEFICRQYKKISTGNIDSFEQSRKEKFLRHWGDCRLWFDNETDEDLVIRVSLEESADFNYIREITIPKHDVVYVYIGACSGSYVSIYDTIKDEYSQNQFERAGNVVTVSSLKCFPEFPQKESCDRT